MRTHRVFVYGTLKRGFENHHLLETSTFAGKAHTLTPYCMLDGRFPVLRDNGLGKHPVAGEVYEVDDITLDALDDLEGVAEGIYRRCETGIALDGAQALLQAFIYIGCREYWDQRPRKWYDRRNERGHIDWQTT